MIKEKKILADTWYADHLTGNITIVSKHFEQTLGKRLLKLSKRFKLVRGFFLFRAAKKFDLVVTNLGGKGVTFFVLLQAIFSKQKKIILLEFYRPTPKRKIYKVIWPFWTKFIYGPSLNRALLKAQALTVNEIPTYAKLFRLPKDRFTYIPWPLHFDEEREKINGQPGKRNFLIGAISNYVMVSGRANVDWETIFAVAEESDWPLLAVCNKENLKRVNRLNKKNRATVMHEIPLKEYTGYLKKATVYVLCLEETNTGGGHIRLMDAIEHGVPVVATDISGLEGYAIQGVNTILVPPKDVHTLKQAIDRLMDNPFSREQLVNSARTFQQQRTFTNYKAEISAWVTNIAAERPSDI